MKTVPGGEFPPYELVSALLNDVPVTFLHNTDDPQRAAFGPAELITIGGLEVRKMYEAEKVEWARAIAKNHGIPPEPPAPAPHE